MSADEPSILEPAPEAPATRSPLIVGIAAFLGGVVLMALIAQFWGGGLWPRPAAPAAPVTTQQASAPTASLPPGTDLATLNAREQMLAARLDALDTKLSATERGASTASGYATRAEGMLVAISVRRLLDRGLPLGALEAQLRQRFGTTHPDQVATIVRTAADPVTVEDLRLALDTIAPRLAVGGPKEGWWRTGWRLISDMVVIRHEATPSPRTADRLDRARHRLDARQVEAALGEVARMPGVENAQSWMTAAKRYIDARRALDDLELSAMQAPAAPSPAPAAAVPPPAQ